MPQPFDCTCTLVSICPACLAEYHRGGNKPRDLIEEMTRGVTDFPQVPAYLGNPGYEAVPKQVAEVLEHSGVIGYLTANDGSGTAFSKLMGLVASVAARDKVTEQIDGELFIRSMCAGWTKMSLDETQTNSVASTADEYYKGLFAQRAKEEEEAKAKPAKNITSSGMKGFSEEAAPQDWDMAIGMIKGFRKWSILLPSMDGREPEVLKGSYGKNFLDHEAAADGRRKATCHQSGSKHPPEEVPADNGCGCGWWAYWAPEEAKKHGGDGGSGSINATIAVEGTGRVVIGQKGFRSQYVKVTGICPDESLDADGMNRLVKFSRMHLLDAPVYATVDDLRDGAGTDPVYGTLAARYPEIARHGSRELAVYVWLLLHIQRSEQLYLGQLTERMKYTEAMRTDVYGNPMPTSPQEELSEEHNYVRISHDLLGTERRTVERILVERGEDPTKLLGDMGVHYSSLG